VVGGLCLIGGRWWPTAGLSFDEYAYFSILTLHPLAGRFGFKVEFLGSFEL